MLMREKIFMNLYRARHISVAVLMIIRVRTTDDMLTMTFSIC